MGIKDTSLKSVSLTKQGLTDVKETSQETHDKEQGTARGQKQPEEIRVDWFRTYLKRKDGGTCKKVG